MSKTIAILTGAGISAESGISTFRDSNGLWENHRIEEVATPEGFRANPNLVQQFYNLRRAQLAKVIPNAAHHALQNLAENFAGRVVVITQNVDDLHGRAQKEKTYGLLYMHGELKKIRCLASEEIFDWHDDVKSQSICPCCNQKDRLRPHIVWFGEMPLHMDAIDHILSECDLFISIGTSGNVYPAAGFVQQVRALGHAHTVELNMEPSSGQSLFHERIYGPATQIVPAYVARILAGEVI